MSFPQIRTTADQLPASILRLLNIDPPEELREPDQKMVDMFDPKAVVMVMIDNFGLFESVVYKPEALIKNMEILALIETDNPYAIPLTKRILSGSATSGFHLFNYVNESGRVVRAICRQDDMQECGFGDDYSVTVRDDMATYIESTKQVFRSQLMFSHFLDFESLYAQYGHRTPPKTLLEKIVRRTDNWIKVLLRQARIGTLFFVVGNHGRHPIPLDYEGKLAEWREANAPIAIVFQKREEIS